MGIKVIVEVSEDVMDQVVVKVIEEHLDSHPLNNYLPKSEKREGRCENS